MNDLKRYPTIEDVVGNTPLVRLKRISAGRNNTLLAKLEGNNPAGSVKDRPALSMINEAEARGDIAPGDTLIEATSGNTGIALAMAAAIKGYQMVLVMPENASEERKQAMAAYGAKLISASKAGGMDRTTGPEVWEQTGGEVTHFVSSMGTTGTIMGVSRYLKEQNPAIQIVGLQPADGASIPGIRRWPQAYLPAIFEAPRVDVTLDIGQQEAEEHMRRLAREEGILAGVSSGGSLAGALRIAEQTENAVIVFIVCDRGDRYLSTGLFAPGV